ncbi:MAG: creatininase family protein [Bacteroidetes bacterium]|nr:creatininase family protein [Bacteroidota bacterium]
MSARQYILGEVNWKDVRASDYQVAVLPWGSCEAHNYHLPYAADTIQSSYIAEESARIAWEKGGKIIVLPAIPYGVNTGQMDIKLTMNMNPSTQLSLLKDIVYSLNLHKINKLMIVNGHGGNDLKFAIRELQLLFPSVFIGLINWYKVVDDYKYFDEPGEHGGEMETSNILYINPEIVRSLKEAGAGAGKKIGLHGFRDGWAWSPREWLKATEDTGLGNPKKATPEKGETYLKVVTEQIALVLYDLYKADLKNIYE